MVTLMALWHPRQLELLARIYRRDMLASRLGGARAFSKVLDRPEYRRAFERGARVFQSNRPVGKYTGPESLDESILSHEEHKELIRLCNPFAVQDRPKRKALTDPVRRKSAAGDSNG